MIVKFESQDLLRIINVFRQIYTIDIKPAYQAIGLTHSMRACLKSLNPISTINFLFFNAQSQFQWEKKVFYPRTRKFKENFPGGFRGYSGKDPSKTIHTRCTKINHSIYRFISLSIVKLISFLGKHLTFELNYC